MIDVIYRFCSCPRLSRPSGICAALAIPRAPCAASPAPSPARRRCGGTANEAGQGHWDNHLSATVGDPAQRSCWPGRLNPGVFPMSPISGAHQERARRAADLGLRRLGASELSEAGKCLGNDFPHDSRRRSQPAGVTKGRKTLPSGGQQWVADQNRRGSDRPWMKVQWHVGCNTPLSFLGRRPQIES